MEVKIESDWICCSTDSYYLWSLMTWSSTTREKLFCYKTISNPLYLPFSPTYIFKRQELKIFEPKLFHKKNYNLSNIITIPKLTKLGKTSMIFDVEIYMNMKAFDEVQNDKKRVLKLIARNKALLIHFEENKSTPHQFRDLKLITPVVSDNNFSIWSKETEFYEVFSTLVKANSSNCDSLGHVHNANYAFLFHDSLMEYLCEVKDISFRNLNDSMSVKRFDINYELPFDCFAKGILKIFLLKDDKEKAENSSKNHELTFCFKILAEDESKLLTVCHEVVKFDFGCTEAKL